MSVHWVLWSACAAWAASAADAGEGCGCSVLRDPSFLHSQHSIPASHDAPSWPVCPSRPAAPTAEDTVLVPGGRHEVGTNEPGVEGDREGPARLVTLRAFRLDRYEVSNAQFAEFVLASGYTSEAEQFGDSFVFALQLNATSRARLTARRAAQAPWWYKVPGADWRHPDGPDSTLQERWQHPAVHVSWHDARAYCSWRGGRLPREAEWEAACRAGRRAARYPWGDKLFPNRMHMANIWQGSFPSYNSGKDGFVGTCPVHLFPQNELGLHNMAGNVWEWTEDAWSSDNPAEERVKKGGSYLCHKSYCYRYRCAARAHNTPDSSAGNLGFRCAHSA